MTTKNAADTEPTSLRTPGAFLERPDDFLVVVPGLAPFLHSDALAIDCERFEAFSRKDCIRLRRNEILVLHGAVLKGSWESGLFKRIDFADDGKR